MENPKKKLRKQLHFSSKEIKVLKFNAQNLYSESCKNYRKKLKKLYKQKVTPGSKIRRKAALYLNDLQIKQNHY